MIVMLQGIDSVYVYNRCIYVSSGVAVRRKRGGRSASPSALFPLALLLLASRHAKFGLYSEGFSFSNGFFVPEYQHVSFSSHGLVCGASRRI